jgi:hypothetical protein
MSFYIKSGDLKPHITATLSGGPSDWTGASAEIVIRSPDGTITTASVTLDDSAKTVEYDWTGFSTTTAGDYSYEWKVTFADGDEMTAPANGVERFRITDGLDD